MSELLTSNVFNKVNALDVGGRSVSILFKVNGDWAGEVFGAPPGLAWTEGDDGSIYLFDAASGSETSTTGSNANVTSSSTASIRNNVSVTALQSNLEKIIVLT